MTTGQWDIHFAISSLHADCGTVRPIPNPGRAGVNERCGHVASVASSIAMGQRPPDDARTDDKVIGREAVREVRTYRVLNSGRAIEKSFRRGRDLLSTSRSALLLRARNSKTVRRRHAAQYSNSSGRVCAEFQEDRGGVVLCSAPSRRNVLLEL